MSSSQNLRNIPTMNLLVAGKSGVGKTTLVNTMFGVRVGEAGVGKPITMDIERHAVPNYPFVVYDVQGFELSNTQEIITKIKNKITADDAFRDMKHMIHAVFYCVSHDSKRLENEEEKFIQHLGREFKVPIFFVFTKAFAVDCNNPSNDPFISYVKNRLLPVVGYYPVLCEKYPYTTTEPFGVHELMNDFFNQIGKLMPAYLSQLETIKRKIKREKAENWLWGYVAGNFATGMLIPAGVDAVVLATFETAMIGHLVAILYDGESFTTKDGIVAALSASMGPMLATFAGTVAFNIVSKIGGYVIAVGTAGVGAGVATATHVAGGLIAARITLSMGRTFISIIEGILEGRIRPENIKSANYSAQLKWEYENAKAQIEKDSRFSPENFNK